MLRNVQGSVVIALGSKRREMELLLVMASRNTRLVSLEKCRLTPEVYQLVYASIGCLDPGPDYPVGEH